MDEITKQHKRTSNYDKFPFVQVTGQHALRGWKAISRTIREAIDMLPEGRKVIALDCYQGVATNELVKNFSAILPDAKLIETTDYMKPADDIEQMIYPFVTDDPVFGYMTSLELAAFFDPEKTDNLSDEIARSTNGFYLIIGPGAALLTDHADLLLFADMPRWEIQLRFRKNQAANLGANNKEADPAYQYKRAFFVDWRVCDQHKKSLMDRWDFILDSTKAGDPKMVTGEALMTALKTAIGRPFRVVPFFDPGPWGGQWLKEVCDLDRSQQNFAWGFDCVPEENSIYFQFGDILFETPAINLVFAQPVGLLGKKVYEAFGTEFPIRFDFLDTMQGGNLSLQVHPLRSYIRENFGMPYTQDESYYILDAKEGASVYLGLRKDIVPEKMLSELETAEENGGEFDAEKYVAKWPVNQHDHYLIPAGTVHCSGANTVVLEISATPYIFTFKLWDWGRMGLDGKPRPISLEHGEQVIQWDRTADWTSENLVNRFEEIGKGDGWLEERTGLDSSSFIETRRHWFTDTVLHDTAGNLNVLNLVSGREAIVESPENLFEPFIIHYAETFIIPAAVGKYTIRPFGDSVGSECASIKASIRTQHLSNYRIN